MVNGEVSHRVGCDGGGWSGLEAGVREEENNEESEETPNTARQAVLRLDSPQYPPAQS